MTAVSVSARDRRTPALGEAVGCFVVPVVGNPIIFLEKKPRVKHPDFQSRFLGILPILMRNIMGLSWDSLILMERSHGFIGKPIPKTSWPVLLSRCGCGSLPWRRTNWAAGLREPIGIWSIWNSSWICWNWSDNSMYLLSRWRVQSWNLQSDMLGWFLQQKPVYPRTFCNWNSRWLVSCFSFSDHPGLKTSSPSHWSPNQWLLEISILEKPQEMGKIFSIGVNDLSPLESVRLRPGRFDDRFSCVSLFFGETSTRSKTLSIFFRKLLICFFLMWGWRICFPMFFFMFHHFLRFPCEPWRIPPSPSIILVAKDFFILRS